MIYIIIMYTTKLSLAPANRLLSVYFSGAGASRGGGLVVVLRAMNRRNGEKEKEGRRKKNRTELTDSSIGTQKNLEERERKMKKIGRERGNIGRGTEEAAKLDWPGRRQ